MESARDEVQPMKDGFSLVNSSDNADLVIRRTDDGELQFERLDFLMSKYPTCLSDIQGVSHFNFHLSRHNRVSIHSSN